MTDRELMQLVAGKSPAAMRGALGALRAIRVESPAVATRVAHVATAALRDLDVDWTPEEREALAEACGRGPGAPLRDDPARARLSVLLADAGLSGAELARVLGRDERTVRRWLAREIAIPASTADWLARVMRIETTRERVTVVLAR